VGDDYKGEAVQGYSSSLGEKPGEFGTRLGAWTVPGATRMRARGMFSAAGEFD